METTVQNTHNIGYIRSHLSSLMDQVGLQKPLTKMGTRRLVEINLDDEANDSETVFCFNGIDPVGSARVYVTSKALALYFRQLSCS